jgi:hypothetical protein
VVEIAVAAVVPLPAAPAMEPPAQVVAPAAATATLSDKDDCSSDDDDDAMVRADHVPSAAAIVSPAEVTPRRGGRGQSAARSDASCDRKRTRSHQDDSEAGFVPLPFFNAAADDDDSTEFTSDSPSNKASTAPSSHRKTAVSPFHVPPAASILSPAPKRNGNTRNKEISEERNTSKKHILVTPGFRKVTDVTR